MNDRRSLLAVLILLLLAMPIKACAKLSMEGSEAKMEMAYDQSAAVMESSDGEMMPPSDSAEQAGQTGDQKAATKEYARKIVKNGTFDLVIEDYEPFKDLLSTKVDELGGYLGNMNVYRSQGSVSSGTITVRIPSQHFAAFHGWLQTVGMVSYESVTTKDISKQYYDTASRLVSQKKLESRLLKLLETDTSDLADVLAVEKELARVRQEIEKLEGTIKYYDNIVALSTITLNLTVTKEYVPKVKPTFWEEVGDGFVDSLHAMGRFFKGLFYILIVGSVWFILAGVVIVLLVIWLRRRRRAKATLGAPPRGAGKGKASSPPARDGATPPVAAGDGADSTPPVEKDA